MENQSDYKKNNVWSGAIIGIVIFLLSSAVAGVGVYLWRESVNNETQANLKEKIDSLQIDLEEMKGDSVYEDTEDSNHSNTGQNSIDSSTNSENETEITISSLSGIINKKYSKDGINYIEFTSNGSTNTYSLEKDIFVLLFECSQANEWHIYSVDNFMSIDSNSLDLCFGEGANGYQITVVNEERVVFLKNGISVP